MAFFEEIGKTLSKAGQGVAQTTKNVVDRMKLTDAISDEKKGVERLFCAIGQQYFNDHADDAEPALAELIEGVKAANVRIAEYSEQLNKIKGVTVCQACGAEVPANAVYCNMCGVKIERPEPAEPVIEPEPEPVTTCYVCGAELEKDARFCTRCGTPVAREEPAED